MTRVVELLLRINPYGPMHIVVDDGNVEDTALDIVESSMKDVATADERELLTLLRSMSVHERQDAWDAATIIKLKEFMSGRT